MFKVVAMQKVVERLMRNGSIDVSLSNVLLTDGTSLKYLCHQVNTACIQNI